jgi:DNA-binding transcriptional LysR family regulator
MNIVRGRLKVDIDPVVSNFILPGRLSQFLGQYPELSLECMAREQIGDLVGDGIDVAVRFGEPAASSLIRRKLVALQVITVATPGYLKRHGRPKHPNDLAHHACIHLRDPLTRQPYDWEFHKGRKVLTVKTRSRLLVSDARTMLTECMSGKRLYRYYVSTGVIKRGPEACSIRLVPAAEVEKAVIDQVRMLVRTGATRSGVRSIAGRCSGRRWAFCGTHGTAHDQGQGGVQSQYCEQTFARYVSRTVLSGRASCNRCTDCQAGGYLTA